MASQTKVAIDLRRRTLNSKYEKKRADLLRTINSPEASEEEVEFARKKFRRIPRNSSKTRIRNRCAVSGRPRGYYRKFGLSRIALRQLGLAGEVPGLTKSSW